jgi:hypothetical protein
VVGVSGSFFFGEIGLFVRGDWGAFSAVICADARAEKKDEQHGPVKFGKS